MRRCDGPSCTGTSCRYAPAFGRFEASPGHLGNGTVAGGPRQTTPARRAPTRNPIEKLGDFTARRARAPHLARWPSSSASSAPSSRWRCSSLIGLFTNLFFFQRWSTALVSPADNHLGCFVVLVPVAGALIIGVMARYGSERIRGHGIPEAIEAILINGSRVEPKVALLKPLSSAISIGSGGPFGAEGPIIMTGGAFGSLVAQFFHLTSAERKTLLVAGAAAGMSATFAAPLAAVLLAVELLLFEWKPRSLIPVALASATAAAVRRYILGLGPALPRAAASRVHRAAGLARLRARRAARRRAVGAADAGRLRRRRRLSASCRSTGCGGRRSAAS